MPEFVRVRDKETGHHVSIPVARYDRERDLWQALKQPATDAGGTALPPKHKSSVSAESEKQKARQSAASPEKESN